MPPKIIISRLSLSGYKSFPDKTEIRFDPGVSVVVGPNGCGKSNICEAVAWVLGSQSPKEFRTQNMADVIFAGTRTRKPLGMSEVSISFYSQSGALPNSENEMIISRRVFKDGGGEYRIDGKVVRLKDLLDLLNDSGFSYSSYSIISQGQIEAFLQMRGSDRRQLIEEAAGVARFREKKRLTVLKLEETRANLQRIDDILIEKERLLRSLKVQAGRARRYREHESRSRELQRIIFKTNYHLLSDERKQLEKSNSSFHVEESQLASALGNFESRAAGLDTSIYEWSGEANTMERLYQEKVSEVTKSRALVEVLENQKTNLENAGKQLVDEMKTVEQRLTSFSKEHHALESEMNELSTGAAAHRDDLNKERSGGEGFDLDEKKLRESLELKRQLLYKKIEEREKTNELLVRSKSETHYFNRETSRVESDLKVVGEQTEELTGKLSAISQERKVCETDAEKLTRGLKDQEQKVQELTVLRDGLIRSQASLTTRIEGWREESDRLSQKIESLKVEERLPALLEIPGSWKPFADTIFHLIAEASIIKKEHGIHLLPSHFSTREIPDATPLSRQLSVTEGAPDWLLKSLPEIYITKEDRLLELSADHPHTLFFTESGSFSWGGLRGNPPYSESGAFSQTINLKELTDNIAKGVAQLEKTEAELLSVEEKRAEERDTLTELRDALANARNSLEGLESRRSDLQKRFDTVQRSLTHLQEALKDLKEQKHTADIVIEESEKKVSELDNVISGTRKKIEGLSAELEKKLTHITDWRGRVQKRSELLSKAELELSRVMERVNSHNDQINNLQERLTGLTSSIEQNSEQSVTVNRTIEEQLAVIKSCEVELGRLVETKSDTQKRGTKLREEKTTLEKSLSQQREKLEDTRKKGAEISTRLEVARVRLQEIVQRCHEVFQVMPAALEGASDPIPLEEAQEELETVRQSMQRLGAVNLIAQEEFENINSDVELIRRERSDLVASLNRLTATANDLEQTALSLFLSTFEEVSKLFSSHIERLFRGGHGELRLQDEDNPLDSGVEIFLQPPGKRLQNMLLLSGGEKALAALALLMALFNYRPSPFIILDEVDAALDDANVERFLNLIEDIRAGTQIILITHNRRTMELADLLLGVTMEDPGCSRIITLPTTRVRATTTPTPPASKEI